MPCPGCGRIVWWWQRAMTVENLSRGTRHLFHRKCFRQWMLEQDDVLWFKAGVRF